MEHHERARWTRWLPVLLTLGLISTPSAEAAAGGAVYRVNSTLDQVDAAPGDGVCRTAAGTCTLRAAIMEAARHPGRPATVVVPAGTYRLTRAPSIRPVDLTASADGPLDVVWPMTITGAGARKTIIDGDHLDRIITIVTPVTRATIQDVTLTGGVATERELLVVTGGGAIANQGNLTLRRVTITGNRADYAGGLFNTPSASATIEDSTISGNVANLEAGGVRFDAAGTVVNSTISGNRILSSCCPKLESYPGSMVGEGGGIDARGAGPVRITNSTIVGNHAVTGGGGVNIATSYQGALGPLQDIGGPIELRNTIVAANTTDAGPANCKHTIALLISKGHNLEDGDSCGLTAAGDVGRTNPLLLPFGNYGGPTDTYELRPGSPAIGRATNCPTRDQRGAPRPAIACDIGAVEHQP
jgi:hypothetical protein